MAFCATCGSQVEGRFCAKCGSPVGAAAPPPPAGAGAPPPPQPQYAPQGQYAQAPPAQSAPMADNVASALSYIFIVNIIFLVIAPYNRNPIVRFHAFQSLFFDVAWFVFWIGLSIVMGIIGGVTGFFGMWSVYLLIRLLLFILWLYLFISAYQGKKIVLPIIGPLAEQQARV